MKRATLLTVLAGLLIALTASVAVAKDIQGTAKSERLPGTDQADTINASGGDDTLFGKAGNDTLNGGWGNDRVYGAGGNDRMSGAGGNDLVSAGPGNDVLIGGFGRDQLQAAGGDDTVRAAGDASSDQIFCSGGWDVAILSLNDAVGGVRVSRVLSATTTVDQKALSCEVLVINGLRIPLGAIVALPTPLEADVSLLLEEYLRDGELSDEEIANLERVFELISEGDEGLLEALLELLLGEI
jgi:hemolysin type calcium-binding protein